MPTPAIYARYSDEKQRAASIVDQVRNGRAVAEREGWPAPIVYSDEKISGSRRDREQYLRMLRDATEGRFDVLIVDDLSRLGRDFVEAESCARQLEYLGVRLISVADGYDSATGTSSGRLLNRGAKNLFNEIHLYDLADKTHRGLTGVALAGNSAGGKSYGYDSTPVMQGGDIVGYRKTINEAEATVVRRVFERYANGASPRQIADELNRDGMPSPRGSTWAHSAIYGDMKRGLGMLNNTLYIGQQIWNRSKWVKDPSGRSRKRVERPESEWIVQDMPELRIVPQPLWERVKARQHRTRQRTRQQRKAQPGYRSGGGKPRYLFSGLLKCGCCGGNYIILDYYRYGCAVHKDRGDSVCSNSVKVRRTTVERVLLRQLRQDLLSDEAFEAFAAEVRRLLAEAAPDPKPLERELTKAAKEAENIMSAIRQGIITPTTKAALEAAESRQKELRARIEAMHKAEPARIIPRMRERWQELVKTFGQDETPKDAASARQALQELFGEVVLRPNQDGVLEAEIKKGHPMAALSEMTLVAGAGFERHFTPLIITLID